MLFVHDRVVCMCLRGRLPSAQGAEEDVGCVEPTPLWSLMELPLDTVNGFWLGG